MLCLASYCSEILSIEDYRPGDFLRIYRPLVAVSKPNFSTRNHWKPFRPSVSDIAMARREFRRRYPKVTNCKNLEDDLGHRWKYRENDIRVANAYLTSDGWALIELQLTGDRCDCPPDDLFIGQWYAIAPTGKMLFLGQAMWLVDVGDYDHSGKDEALFAIDGENQGGYRLFYSNFSQRAEFSFQYH